MSKIPVDELERISLKLFTVGPVACYPEVLEAMGQQMYSHRSKEYFALHYETVKLLQSFVETRNEVFLFSSTGTGFMEASVRNCVRKNILCCINGSFGERFSEVAAANGKTIVRLEPPLGEGPVGRPVPPRAGHRLGGPEADVRRVRQRRLCQRRCGKDLGEGGGGDGCRPGLRRGPGQPG
jgi:hypothetical protein